MWSTAQDDADNMLAAADTSITKTPATTPVPWENTSQEIHSALIRGNGNLDLNKHNLKGEWEHEEFVCIF